MKIKSIQIGMLFISALIFIGGSSLAQTDDARNEKKYDTLVKITYKEKAQYTEEARENEQEGIVILSAIFKNDGTITDIRIDRGLPYGLTENAILALRKIRFEPATKDGTPVSVRTKIQFNFNLHDDAYEVMYLRNGEKKSTFKRIPWKDKASNVDSFEENSFLIRRIKNKNIEVSVGLSNKNESTNVILMIKNNTSIKQSLFASTIHFWGWNHNNINTIPTVIESKKLDKKDYWIKDEIILKKEFQVNIQPSFKYIKYIMITVKVNDTYYEFLFDRSKTNN